MCQFGLSVIDQRVGSKVKIHIDHYHLVHEEGVLSISMVLTVNGGQCCRLIHQFPTIIIVAQIVKAVEMKRVSIECCRAVFQHYLFPCGKGLGLQCLVITVIVAIVAS